MPGWYVAHVQDDVNPHILRMLEGTFSLDVTQIIVDFVCLKSFLLRINSSFQNPLIFTTAGIDWLQSPVTKYFFLIILFDNPPVTSLYSHDIILVLF